MKQNPDLIPIDKVTLMPKQRIAEPPARTQYLLTVEQKSLGITFRSQRIEQPPRAPAEVLEMVQRDLPYEPDGGMDGTGASIDAPEGETEPMTVPAVPEEQRNEDTPQLSQAASLSFESEEGFRGAAAEWPMKRLVEAWNSVPGVIPVRKFENRETALRRIWSALQPQTTAAFPAARSRSVSRKPGATFREGSKAAQVHALLCRPEGATLNEIRSATGWQAHSVRGFISGTLRKQKQPVRSFRREGERVYRIKL